MASVSLRKITQGFREYRKVVVLCTIEMTGGADWLNWSDYGDKLNCKRSRLLYID